MVQNLILFGTKNPFFILAPKTKKDPKSHPLPHPSQKHTTPLPRMQIIDFFPTEVHRYYKIERRKTGFSIIILNILTSHGSFFTTNKTSMQIYSLLSAFLNINFKKSPKIVRLCVLLHNSRNLIFVQTMKISENIKYARKNFVQNRFGICSLMFV